MIVQILESLLAIFVLLLLVAVVYLFYWGKEKRKSDLREWADQYGLKYEYGRDHSLRQEFSDFDILVKGHGNYAHHHIWGEWSGLPFYGFDYHFKTGFGRSTTHYDFSAVAIAFPFELPRLIIRPETKSDRFIQALGLNDIDFESIEFSDRFYVYCDDRKIAHDVLHPRTMEFLMEVRECNLHFHKDKAIIYFNDNYIFKPHEFGFAAEIVCEVIKRMPDYLIEKLTARIK